MFFRERAAMCRSTAISEACIGRPWIGPLSRASSGTSRNSSSTELAPITRSISLRSASERGRYLTGIPFASPPRKRGSHFLSGHKNKRDSRLRGNDGKSWLPHDETKPDVIGDIGAEAACDRGADLGAFLPRHAGAVEPAAAEGRLPLGDAVFDRRGPFDQTRIDFAESRGFVDAGEFLGRWIPVDRRRRRRISADDQLLVERLAQLRDIAFAAHLSGEAAAAFQGAEDAARDRLLVAHPVQCRIG